MGIAIVIKERGQSKFESKIMLTRTFLSILVWMTILFASRASASEIEEIWLALGDPWHWHDLITNNFPLKTGHYPDKRPFNNLDSYRVKSFIHTPHGEIKDACLIDKKGQTVLSFPTLTKGVYSAFFVVERVIDKIREIHISKQEINGDQFWYGKPLAGLNRKTLTVPRLTREVPFELIRERKRMEIMYIFPIKDGDFITFRTYFRGNPQEGAPVTLTTREGWSKTVITDADGRATFQLIRDDYKRKFSRITRGELLVKASLITPEEGQIADSLYTQTHYRMTWLIDTAPSDSEMFAKIDFLYLFVLTVFMVGGGSFLYRFLTLKSNGKSESDEKI